uniref:Uncharacterized protein n=1 Tax=Ditylenchus dipsaci TaxID=166011 RepID=A0A915ET07_9BILA
MQTTEARRRTREMTHLFHSYNRYTPEKIGEQYDVLICEMATDGVSYVGHNKTYEHILVSAANTKQNLLAKGPESRSHQCPNFT